MTTFENEGKKMKQSGKIEREKENKFKKGKKRKTEGMTRKSGVKEQGTPPQKKIPKKEGNNVTKTRKSIKIRQKEGRRKGRLRKK